MSVYLPICIDINIFYIVCKCLLIIYYNHLNQYTILFSIQKNVIIMIIAASANAHPWPLVSYTFSPPSLSADLSSLVMSLQPIGQQMSSQDAPWVVSRELVPTSAFSSQSHPCYVNSVHWISICFVVWWL